LIELIKIVTVTFLCLATCRIINTVINTLKQKNEKKAANLIPSLTRKISSQVKNIVTAPEAIRMFRVFFEKWSEKIPERIMAVKIVFLTNTL